MTAESYEPEERQARPLRTALIVALLAFIFGAAVVTWALTRWEPARRLILPVVSASPTAQPLTTAPEASANPALSSAPLVPLSPESVAVTESRVAGLEARLAHIDVQASNAASNAARAEGLLIAFAARRTIDRGIGLGYLEGQLRDRFAETQPRAVAAIISAAQAPVTLDALRQQLDILTPDLAGGGPNESWTAAAQRTFGSLFIVRKATSPSPAADDRVSRARLAIEGGQVENALAEVARLPSRGAASEWMASARRYIEAHRALDILEAAALTAPHSLPPPTAGQATQ